MKSLAPLPARLTTSPLSSEGFQPTNLKSCQAGLYEILRQFAHQGNEQGQAFRDIELEKVLLEVVSNLVLVRNLGVNISLMIFGHSSAASRWLLPDSYGALLFADRNIKAKINKHGIWLEKLDTIRGNIFQPHCGKKITRNMSTGSKPSVA